ncbi:DNA-binding transcriptional regulator, LysR family [Streptomyces sp. 2112.3]|nr:DNA-binding transcriptional LysR family regulator [Streptomyces sp. 2321.6]SDR59109.1 DNA-binding transcriptional regulator, LysR family [Streptomyces sp. KS_16]SEB70994.1 DNA-binding transcriptional regulator, LysR family [Streptomyces sp. 2133.1]SEF17922.1 DNA-binding transcriptional regulator, LysR family [Streptomyces sp. 2112.3]SNC59938.1 DNA-binding transcriptional regulator, LysR family [Streptomyces sp. 2114.4]
MLMDPQQLRTFVAVVDHRSFSVAAQALGYTQSAVSQHIASLETDLEAPLLTRRPVAPTEAGERLLDHARPLLLRLEAARADVVRLRQVRPGRLAVACTPGALTPATALALVRARTEAPQLATSVRVCGRREAVQAVLTGAADLALVDGAVAPSDPLPLPDAGPLTAFALSEEPLAVLLPAAHPLVGRPALRLADLAAARWIDAPDAAIPLAQLRAAAQSDGFGHQLTYTGTDIRGLSVLVAAGAGLTVAALPAAGELPGIVAVPITEPRLVHRTELLHPRTPTTPAAELVDTLRRAQ